MNKTDSISRNSSLFKRKQKSFFAEGLQDSVLDDSLLYAIAKFHQSTTWHSPFYWNVEKGVQDWLSYVEHTDVLPEFTEKKIVFDEPDISEHTYKSCRDFDPNGIVSLKQLGRMLSNAFGRSSETGSKPYPSAGALYPIIPLVYIFDAACVDGKAEEGCYVYDSVNRELLMIKKFGPVEIEKIQQQISPHHSFFSKTAIGYALDIKRAITKYKKRGYRHGLMEVGLMAQSFRQSLTAFPNMGEFCWSGFNDNSLTHLSGLNPKLAPITLIQWFGQKS